MNLVTVAVEDQCVVDMNKLDNKYTMFYFLYDKYKLSSKCHIKM